MAGKNMERLRKAQAEREQDWRPTITSKGNRPLTREDLETATPAAEEIPKEESSDE